MFEKSSHSHLIKLQAEKQLFNDEIRVCKLPIRSNKSIKIIQKCLENICNGCSSVATSYLNSIFLRCSKLIEILQIYPFFLAKKNFCNSLLSLKKICGQIVKQKQTLVNRNTYQVRNLSDFCKKNYIFNPIHLCSNHAFVKNWKINEGQMYQHRFIKMKRQDINDSEKIIKKLCAGLNGIRSYMVLGVTDDNKIQGEVFSEEGKEEITRKVYTILRNRILFVRPEEVRIRFIPVLNSSRKQSEVLQDAGRYLLLIEFSKEQKRTFVFQKVNNVIFRVNKKNQQVKGEQIYSAIQEFYFQSKPKIKHFQCVEPKIGNTIECNKNLTNWEQNKELSSFSVLISSSKNHIETVERLWDALKENKITFKQSNLAEKYSTPKSCWLLKHCDQFKVILNIVKKLDKCRCLQLYEVSQKLMIPNNNKDENIWKKINSQLDIQKLQKQKQNSPNGCLILTFKQKEEALKKWLQLKKLNIEATFTKTKLKQKKI